MTAPCDLSALEARRLIGKKELSPVELLESCLDRIAATNGAVNAIVTMDEPAARKAAKAAEKAVVKGEPLGLLHGLPIGIKDLQDTAGLRTTYGSLLYENHVPARDNAMVVRLREQGGIILAKTNTPEFGAGANTTNRVFGATGNPFDPKLTPAGSSGGSACALALGQLPLATGSDYGGSLRTPAAFCGVAGFRPSPGVVPGETRAVALTPFAVAGPMGRSIADLHLLLRAQIGVDAADPFSSGDAMALAGDLDRVDLATVRAAFSVDLGCAPIDSGIAKTFAERTALFRGVFRSTVDAEPPMPDVHETFEVLRGIYFVGAHRERLERHRDRLGRNVIDNTERGLKYTLGDVAGAYVNQTRIYQEFLRFFEDLDVIVTPAASVSPFPHEQLFIAEINGRRMETYMRWLAIAYAFTTALACIAVIPCGVDEKGMPFGLQVAGPKGSDRRVLAIAHALEQHLAGLEACRRPVPDLGRLSKSA